MKHSRHIHLRFISLSTRVNSLLISPVTLTHLSGRPQTRTKAIANETFFYPNPSYAGDIIIDIPDYDDKCVYSYSIQSASGGIVNKGLLSQKVSDLSLDISSGVYFVSLIQEGKLIMDRVGSLHSSKYDIASDHVSLSNIPIQFPIIIIIDEYGRVNKKMLLQY